MAPAVFLLFSRRKENKLPSSSIAPRHRQEAPALSGVPFWNSKSPETLLVMFSGAPGRAVTTFDLPPGRGRSRPLLSVMFLGSAERRGTTSGVGPGSREGPPTSSCVFSGSSEGRPTSLDMFFGSPEKRSMTPGKFFGSPKRPPTSRNCLEIANLQPESVRTRFRAFPTRTVHPELTHHG